MDGASAAVDALARLGGVASRAALVRSVGRAEVDRALGAGEVVVPARGRYALIDVDAGLSTAHELSGVLSYRSAAANWGWAVKVLPERPDVTLPRNRKVDAERARRVTLHRADLHADDVVGTVTSRERTVVDCLRNLPGDEALVIADSALRAGQTTSWLTAVARDVRGAGAFRVREIAARANPDAANPFESVLRDIGDTVAGLHLVPQQAIREPRWLGRPDLVDREIRIIAEADSFEWHGKRAALARDARRYNALVVHGWLVLRFSWEDVMHHPDLVRDTLVHAVAERLAARCATCRAA